MKRKIVLGLPTLGLALAAVVATPVAALASQWNSIYGSTTTSYTMESYTRSVTNDTNVYIKCTTIPSGGLRIYLGNAKVSGYPAFTGETSVTSLNTQYTVATGVLSGTKFNVWKKQILSGSNNSYQCQLYY